MSLESPTVDGLGILAHGGGLVGEVATLREDLRSVDVVCFVHAIIMAQNGGKINPPCATSVVVPSLGDAATGTAGETRILNGLSLATVGRGTVERGFDRVDRVAVAIDVLNQRDGVIQCVLHHVHGHELNAIGESETEVTHGVFVCCVYCKG